MAKSERLKLGDNSLRTLYVYLQRLWRNWPAKQSNSVKKTQNKDYHAVQGHRGRYQSKARMRLIISV